MNIAGPESTPGVVFKVMGVSHLANVVSNPVYVQYPSRCLKNKGQFLITAVCKMPTRKGYPSG